MTEPTQEIARLVELATYHLDDLDAASAVVPAAEAVTLARSLFQQRGDAHRPLLITALDTQHVTLYLQGATDDATATLRDLIAHLRLEPGMADRLAGALRALGEAESGRAAVDALRESAALYTALAGTDPAHAPYRDAVVAELGRAIDGGFVLDDAVDRAFADLNGRGIVALQDAGSTMSDGWAAAREAAAGRDDVRGAVFYHRQDLERALAGGGLLLAFGDLTGDDDLAIGNEVRAALESHGLPVEWTGSAGDRIGLRPRLGSGRTAG